MELIDPHAALSSHAGCLSHSHRPDQAAQERRKSTHPRSQAQGRLLRPINQAHSLLQASNTRTLHPSGLVGTRTGNQTRPKRKHVPVNRRMLHQLRCRHSPPTPPPSQSTVYPFPLRRSGTFPVPSNEPASAYTQTKVRHFIQHNDPRRKPCCSPSPTPHSPPPPRRPRSMTRALTAL
jgi:hypothetical protein